MAEEALGVILPLVLATATARDLPSEVLPDHPWDVQHLDLDVRLDLDAGGVEGIVTLDVTRRGAPAPVLRLHQIDLDIRQVQVDGTDASYRLRRDQMEIDVPVDRDQVQVQVTYAATPVTGLHFRGRRGAPRAEARMVWSQGEDEDHRYWYPSWDYPSDRFTVTTHVTVEQGDTAVALGRLTGKEPLDDGWTRWSYALDTPVVNYLVAIVAGAVDEVPMDGGAGVPLSMIVPRGTDRPSAQRALEPTAAQLAWFTEALDEPLPYPVFRQAFAPRFLYGGMENPGLVILADRLRLSHPDEDPRHTHQVVAHELAHQWFGDLLTCYGWRELWLNEGFATYWAGRWREHADGPEAYAEKVRGWHDGALRGDAPMSPGSWTAQGSDNARVYVHGASFLNMLEVALGRTTFDRGIQAWIDRHGGQLVESGQLRRVLEDVSGRNLSPWFDAFVHDAGHPSFTSRWSWDPEAKQVRITIEQTGDRDPVGVPIEVAIPSAEGGAPLVTTWAYAGTTTLVRDVAQAPSYVAVDPRGGVLAHWSHDQTAAQWAAQATEAPFPFARLVALDALQEHADSVDTLVAVVADAKTSDAERRAAARSLAQLPSPMAADALEAALDGASPGLRSQLYDSLGHMNEHAPVERLLRDSRSATWPVRVDALAALVDAQPSRAAAAAARWLSAPDRTDGAQLHGAAISALRTTGDGSHLAALLPHLRDGTPVQSASRVVRTAGTLAEDLDADDSRRIAVVRRLEGLLSAADLRVQQAAIAWLGRIGDADSAEALTRYSKGTRWDDMGDDALDAARLIRQWEAPSSMPDADLKALEARIDALVERIEHLERH